MDILKRNSAPISSQAWEEIDNTAKEVLTNMLSARKVLKVNGPKGWSYNAVDEGRLQEIDKASKTNVVQTGVYQIKRLVEARVSFQLSKWELDNIARGCKDPDLGALEDAVEAIAHFEENALFNGYEKGEIEGLIPVASHKMALSSNPNELLLGIGQAKYELMNAYVKPPYDMIVSKELYEQINVIYEGAHLMDEIKKLTMGEIYRAKNIEGGILVPRRDEDLEFTVGQDFSIGYEKETDEMVQLFVTESFTLRVLDPDKVVHFSVPK